MDINKPIGTLTAGMKKSSCGYFTKKNNDYFGINKKEAMLCQTFPEDYNFLDIDLYYLIGMSVPPVMTAQIAKQVYEQWLKNIK